MIDSRHVTHAAVVTTGTMDLHHVPQRGISMWPVDQFAEFATVGLVDCVVGVHPKQPRTASVFERLIACGGEIVAPGEVIHRCPEPLGNFWCFIFRAGVDDDHFVDPGADSSQRRLQRVGIIANDHAERNGIRRCRI